MRNIAYFRALKEARGDEQGLSVKEKDFWRTASNNCLDTVVLDWCKLFGGSNNEEHAWEKVVTDTIKFKAELLTAIKTNDEGFENYRKEMRTLRDKFLAHLDSEHVMNIPYLDLAKASVEFYHQYLTANEAKAGELAGLADTPERLREGYERCEASGREVFAAFAAGRAG